MPFDLYVTRAASLEAMRGEAPSKPGLLGRMFAKAPPPPITRDELDGVMRGAPAERREDGFRVTHPDGDPWFVVAWREPGHVLLSTSYSSHRFLRNFADMCDLGLRLARGLGARLFEEVGGRELTAGNVDALLDPDGAYVALQADTWRRVRAQLASDALAPLELPVGPIDLVAEYVRFEIAPARPVDGAPVSIVGVALEQVDDGAWLLSEPGGEPLTRILRRPDQTWQVWPAWGRLPFARIAAVTIDAAEQLAEATGGALELDGRRYDGALRDEARARAGGLGVDFYAWTQQLAG